MQLILKKYTPTLLLLAIIGGILLIIVTLTMDLLDWRKDWQITHHTIAIDTHSRETYRTQQALIRTLPELHLFGRILESTSNMPVSTLEVRVTGIAKSNQNESANPSSAYLSISGQPSKIFHTGDTVTSGVKLYEITDQAVVFENNGRLEKVPLLRSKLTFKPRNDLENP